MRTEQEIRDALRTSFRNVPPLPDAALRSVLERLPETPQDRVVHAPVARRDRWGRLAAALQFAVAGLVVAGFGGSLVIALLTDRTQDQLATGTLAAATASPTAPAPSDTVSTPVPEGQVRSDLLPGVELLVREVEPGVFHVVGDGVRDLSWPVDRVDLPQDGLTSRGIAAGRDGSVWLFWPDEYFRLGEPTSARWGTTGVPHMRDGFEVTADGAVYRHLSGTEGRDRGPVHRLAGPGNTSTPTIFVRDPVDAVVLDRESRAWTATAREPGVCQRHQSPGRPCRTIVLHEGGPGGRDRRYPGPELVETHEYVGVVGLWATHDGEIRVADAWRPRGSREARVGTVVSRLDGRSLTRYETQGPWLFEADMAPDGTLWGRIEDEENVPYGSRLARFDGREWSAFDERDGVPGIGRRGYDLDYGLLAADVDGSVWLTPIVLGSLACRGVTDYDVDGSQTFLRDHCIYAMDVAPDGSLWVQAHREPVDEGVGGTVETYVIRAGAEGARG